MKAYRAASVAMTDRKSRMAQVADRVERRLTLIGATAIEDRLQDGVPDTISKLALAGIKLWVLTGDKVETAINIACSCNLIESNSDVIRVTGCKSAEEVSERLDHAYEQFIVPLDRGGLQAPRDGDDEMLVVNSNNNKSDDVRPRPRAATMKRAIASSTTCRRVRRGGGARAATVAARSSRIS
jgi:magnesium-transporting ATPase (P-type)